MMLPRPSSSNYPAPVPLLAAQPRAALAPHNALAVAWAFLASTLQWRTLARGSPANVGSHDIVAMIPALTMHERGDMRSTYRLSWDQYFMAIAAITSLRSQDPRRSVGAVLVDARNHIVGTGYNGFIRGTPDDAFSWSDEADWVDSKYPYVVHAEQNAVLNATVCDLRECRIYVTHFPCHECTRLLAQKQVLEIVYCSDHRVSEDSHVAALRMVEAANLAIRQIGLPDMDDVLRRLKGAESPDSAPRRRVLPGKPF